MSLLTILPFLAASIYSINTGDVVGKNSYNNDHFELVQIDENNYKITGVKEEYLEATELRVYNTSEYHVSEIADGAFDSCTNLISFVLSDCVTTLPTDLFAGAQLTSIGYTGSIESFNDLNLVTTNVVFEYAGDEGFINYWTEYVRPTPDFNICDVTKAVYQKAQSLFDNMSLEDRESVKDIQDGEGEDTILDSLNYLKELHRETKKENRTKEASKSTMIVFILIIASLGMSFICVFYLLRERNIIN